MNLFQVLLPTGHFGQSRWPTVGVPVRRRAQNWWNSWSRLLRCISVQPKWKLEQNFSPPSFTENLKENYYYCFFRGKDNKKKTSCYILKLLLKALSCPQTTKYWLYIYYPYYNVSLLLIFVNDIFVKNWKLWKVFLQETDWVWH